MEMKLKTLDVEYNTVDDKIKAYLVYPDNGKKYPGIVLIHEIFGLDEHTKDVARRLALEGYVVLAPHLFSSKKLASVLTSENITETMKFMMSIPVEKQRDENYRAEALEKLEDSKKKAVMSVNEVLFIKRPNALFTEYLSSGVDYLNSLDNVNGKIGSAGFCFGGGMSINLGCTGKTDATIIFYGENPESIDSIKNVKGAVMGLYGGEDMRIDAGIPDLAKALLDNKIPFTLRVFKGAHHAFFNDTRPQTYNKSAAEKSWKMLLDFYKENLS